MAPFPAEGILTFRAFIRFKLPITFAFPDGVLLRAT
jgi:hypothetical protein